MPHDIKIIKWSGLISICPNCLNGVRRTGDPVLFCPHCDCTFPAGGLQGEFDF